MLRKEWAALMLISGMCAVNHVKASPNDYVSTPTVDASEKEIDFKWGVATHEDGTSDTATSIGFGLGVNDWWFTEVYGKFKREAGAPSFFDAWEWENRFQLTPTGQYPIDIGVLLEIERPKDRSEGYELVYGPLVQAERGKLQGNLNVLFEKHVSADAHFDTELKYQMQVKYRQSEAFEWGAQAFGELGQWDDWHSSSSQAHVIGPALFGTARIGQLQSIHWNAALLHGVTHASADTTLRVQTEYEFY